ncbi:MAG: type II secretion system protein [Patescibacteria group bacterium]
MIQHSTQTHTGFSLIELIVSLGLFSVVITVSVGSLLVLIGANQREQATQNIMTNLAFSLDSMTREIRTGFDYYCEGFTDLQVTSAFANQESITGQNSCPDGISGTDNHIGISVIEGGCSITGCDPADPIRIAYWIDFTEQAIFRRVGNGTAERITSSGINVIDGEFIVTNAERLTAGDTNQPIVTIYIEAEDVTGDTPNTVRLQTTITQRTLDI